MEPLEKLRNGDTTNLLLGSSGGGGGRTQRGVVTRASQGDDVSGWESRGSRRLFKGSEGEEAKENTVAAHVRGGDSVLDEDNTASAANGWDQAGSESEGVVGCVRVRERENGLGEAGLWCVKRKEMG